MVQRKTTPSGRTSPWERVIYGEAASKANSRKLVTSGGKPMFIKSDKARRFVSDFQKQCPQLDPMFIDDVCVEMDMYYASRRPDLDESAALDALQGKVYVNDRCVKKKIITWHLDKEAPRIHIRITRLAEGPARDDADPHGDVVAKRAGASST